jgi:hypothetical protein
MDEYHADTVFSDAPNTAAEILLSAKAGGPDIIMAEGGSPLPIMSYIDNHIWLRGHLNRILHLYTPTRAYARPHELAELVTRLSSELRQWYHRQPLHRQFARDATTFNMNEASMPLRDVSF